MIWSRVQKQMTKRIGFCCKYINHDFTVPRDYNGTTTTVAWLNRQPKPIAEKRLWEIMIHNFASTKRVISALGVLPVGQRMFRVGSDLLPVYTEPHWRYFWQQSDVRWFCETSLREIGDLARELDVRLSFHPGQFCCLASDNDDTVARSIEEFEYHVQCAKWMGYGATWHDHGFKINVHLSGRRGVEGFRNSLGLLSPEARNLITVENDEYQSGLDDVLQLADDVAVVMDLHHHWIHSYELIQPTDDRVARVVDSWRGVRPVMHYSQSREDILVNHNCDILPDIQQLVAQGHKRNKLRAHSDFLWNQASNRWALSFWDRYDVCVEAKFKNLASQQLFTFSSSL